jgi:hypothetical protein
MNAPSEGTPGADPGADVRTTVDDLQGGLVQMPRDRALGHIDAWHRRLSASDRADLQQIAAGLRELKSHLSTVQPDADAIGSAMAQLGRQTVAAARSAESDDAGRAVDRLGHLLLHAGHALRGPRPVAAS